MWSACPQSPCAWRAEQGLAFETGRRGLGSSQAFTASWVSGPASLRTPPPQRPPSSLSPWGQVCPATALSMVGDSGVGSHPRGCTQRELPSPERDCHTPVAAIFSNFSTFRQKSLSFVLTVSQSSAIVRDLCCCRGPTASVTNCGPASQCQAKNDGRGSDRLRPAGGRGPQVSDTQEPALGGTEAPRLLPEGVTLAPLPRTGGDAGGAGSPPGSGRARARAASWGPFRGSQARGALCSAGSGAEASSRPVSARGSLGPAARLSG